MTSMAYMMNPTTHPNHDDPWWIEPVDAFHLDANPHLKGLENWFFVAHDDYGGAHAYFHTEAQAQQYVQLMRAAEKMPAST